MEKEKSDAALPRIFGDPYFLLFSIGIARTLHTPALRAWNTPAESSATRHRWTCAFSCMNSFIQYLKVHLIKITSILVASRQVVRNRYQVFNLFIWRGLFVAVKPVSALCVSPDRVCRQLFHHLALSFDPSTHDNNWLQRWCLLTIFSTPQPLHPFSEHVCRRQPARMRSCSRHACGVPYIYIHGAAVQGGSS